MDGNLVVAHSLVCTTTKSFDYEEDGSQHTYVMEAVRDLDVVASAKITLNVGNENEHLPKWPRKQIDLVHRHPLLDSVYSLVGRVEASDDDGDDLVYKVAGPVPPRGVILVPATGEVLVRAAEALPDGDATPSLAFEVTAFERRDPTRVSEPATVTVSRPAALDGGPAKVRSKRRVTRAVRPTKRIEFTEADGEPEGKIVFQLEKESEHETFKIRDENPWVTVEPNGSVRVKKKWDYEELGREKTIDFWVIISNSGTSGNLIDNSKYCVLSTIKLFFSKQNGEDYNVSVACCFNCCARIEFNCRNTYCTIVEDQKQKVVSSSRHLHVK